MTGPGGTFENAVNIGAKTWKARQQNLQDAKQLAQSELGQWMLDFGGSGKNDSLAYGLLNLQESIYGIVQNTMHLVNINKSVKNIEKQNNTVAKLQDQYNSLKIMGADKEILDNIIKRIKEESNYINPEQQRAAYRTAYDMEYDKIKGREVVSKEEYNKILNDAAVDTNFTRIDEDKYELNNGIVKTHDEMMAFIEEVEAAKIRLGNIITESEFNAVNKKIKEYYQGAMLSYADQFFSTAEESLDKAINKNPKGIGAQRLKSEEEYRNSTLGQREEKLKTIKERNKARDDWDKFDKMIDENGILLNNFKGTMKDVIELYKSGIITPLERISITPEKLSNNLKWLPLDESLRSDEESKRLSNWNTFQKQFLTQYESLKGLMSPAEFEQVKKIRDSMYYQTQVYGPNGAILKETIKGNTDVNVNYVGAIFGEILKKLQEMGSGELANIIAQSAIINSETNKPDTVNFDTYPLWQRILNKTFGTELSLFKNGAIKTGDQAVNLWANQQQRTGIASISRAMMNTMSYKDVLGNLAGVNTDPRNRNYVIGNTSNNGVSQIDWKQTYKNFTDFAMSMESATSVTQAYVDSLTADTDSLKDFMTQAFTITEDATNVYDPSYREHLGKLADNIKALDANAYDMMFKRDDNGEIVGLRENAAEAARALLEEKNTMLAFADAVSMAKTEIDSMNQQIRSLNFSTDLNLGKYSNSKKFEGMRQEDIESTIEKLGQELDKDIWKNLLNKYFQGQNSEDYIPTILESYAMVIHYQALLEFLIKK